jgi:hypothetical protein
MYATNLDKPVLCMHCCELITKQVVPRALQQSAFDSALVPASSTKPEGTSSSSGSVIPHPVDAEFTEEEIESAFKFLDLDRNNYIGAAEIRCCTVTS